MKQYRVHKQGLHFHWVHLVPNDQSGSSRLRGSEGSLTAPSWGLFFIIMKLSLVTRALATGNGSNEKLAGSRMASTLSFFKDATSTTSGSGSLVELVELSQTDTSSV